MSFTLREQCQEILQVDTKKYHIFSLPRAAQHLGNIESLPKYLKVLLENLLRWQDGDSVTAEDIQAWSTGKKMPTPIVEIAYRPARLNANPGCGGLQTYG